MKMMKYLTSLILLLVVLQGCYSQHRWGTFKEWPGDFPREDRFGECWKDMGAALGECQRERSAREGVKCMIYFVDHTVYRTDLWDSVLYERYRVCNDGYRPHWWQRW